MFKLLINGACAFQNGGQALPKVHEDVQPVEQQVRNLRREPNVRQEVRPVLGLYAGVILTELIVYKVLERGERMIRDFVDSP